MSKGVIPVGALLCAAAIAGCGSSSSSSTSGSTTPSTAAAPSVSSFKATFTAARGPLKQLGHTLGVDVVNAKTKTNAQLAVEFDALASQVHKTATTFHGMAAPAQFKARVGAIGSALDQVGTDLSTIAKDARSDNAAGAKATTTTLIGDAAQVKLAENSIAKALGLPPA